MSGSLTFWVYTDISHTRSDARHPATLHHPIHLLTPPTLSLSLPSPSTSQICSPPLERITLRAITRRRVTATSSAAIGIRVGKLCGRPPRRIVSAETSRLNISRNTRAIRQSNPAPAAIVRNIVYSSSWCAPASVIGLRRAVSLFRGWKDRFTYLGDSCQKSAGKS